MRSFLLQLIIALIVLALGALAADAGPIKTETKIEWNAGHLIVEGTDVYFEVPGNPRGRVHLKNLNITLSPSTTPNKMNGEIKVSEMLTDKNGASQLLQKKLLATHDIELVGGKIKGLHVFARTLPNGRETLLIVVPRNHSTFNGTPRASGYLIGIELGYDSVQSLTQQKEAKALRPSVVAENSSFNKITNINFSDNAFTIFDSSSMLLRSVGVLYSEDESYETNHGLRYLSELGLIQLPSEFGKVAVDFSEIGTLYPYNANKGSFILQTNTGENYLFGATNVEETEEARSTSSGRRILWTTLPSAILANYPPIKEETLESFDETARAWLDKTFDKKIRKKTSGSNGRKLEVPGLSSVMLYEVSEAVSLEFPETLGSAVKKLIDLKKTSGHASSHELIYFIKTPESFDSSLLSASFAAITNQLQRDAVAGKTEPLLIIDVSQASRRFFPTTLVEELETIAVAAKKAGASNIKVALFGNRDFLFETSMLPTFESNVASVERTSLDQLLTLEQRATVIVQVLEKMGMSFEKNTIMKTLEEIRRENLSRSALFQDLTALGHGLATVFNHVSISPNDDRFASLVARLYSQLNGDRKVGPFSLEELQRANKISKLLSTRYPGHLKNALSGRDELLRAIESKIVGWLGGGYRDSNSLALLFNGDTGTGKTMTATGIGEVLGAVVESLNMSSLNEGFPAPSVVGPYFDYEDFEYSSGSGTGFSKRHENFLVKTLQESIDKLILDPNPLKVLILDEIHTRPEIFNILLPALGNFDKKAPGVINLDGVIVILCGNVDTNSEAFAKLINLFPGDAAYPAQMLELFKTSYFDGKRGVEDKVLGALGGRLLPEMFFFPPIGMDRSQQTSLIDGVISAFESKYKIRLVVQGAALERLQELATAYAPGNYRSVEKALRTEIAGAIARHKLEQGSEEISGYFILSTTGPEGRKQLSLLEVEGDSSGLASVIEDGYKRYSTGISLALDFADQLLKEESPVGSEKSETLNLLKTSRRSFQIIRDAFDLARQTALFDAEKPTGSQNIVRAVPKIELPTGLSPNSSAKLFQFASALTHSVYDYFANVKSGAVSPKDRKILLDISDKANRLMMMMTKLMRFEAEKKAGDAKFMNWVEKARATYMNDANKKFNHVAEGSIDALSVATGYLLNSLGRDFSGELFDQLKKESMNKSIVHPATKNPDVAPLKSGLSADCEKLLRGGAVAREDIDKLLN